MQSTVQMNAGSIGGMLFLQNSGPVAVPASGVITVNSLDAPDLLKRGATYINNSAKYYLTPIGPRAASAGRIVASTTLSNGTATIANQPDVPRQCALVFSNGTAGITAGQTVLTYVANDGTNQVDTTLLNAIPVSGSLTVNTSKGVVSLTSMITTGLTGGTSPTMQLNDTNNIALPVDPGFYGLTINRSNTDGTIDTTIDTAVPSAGCFAPTTTPNATHVYGLYYTVNSGNQA